MQDDSVHKLETMRELADLQQRVIAATLTIAAAGSRPPDDAYECFLSLARDLLDGVAEFEAQWPGTYDVETTALPLVQQLSMYADHQQDAGDAQRAALLRQEADEISDRYLGEFATAGVRRTRAMDAAANGHFHEALIGLDDARDVFLREGDLLEAVKTDLRLANVYEWLGDNERALTTLGAAYARVAPQLSQGIPSAAAVTSAINRQMFGIQDRGQNTKEGEDALALRYIAYEVIQAQARNNRALGNLDEAERLFLEARPFVAEMGLTAGVDFHLAVIACARKDAATAERIIGEIAPAFDAPGVRPRRGALRQIQADLHLLRGEPQQALSAAEDGLLDQTTYPDLDQAWKLKWRRARALVAAEQLELAVAAYRDCLNDVDRLRMAPLGYRLDTTFLRDKLPMAYEAIDLAVRENDAEAVIWCVELIKSRALSATLSVPRSPASGHSPQEVRFSEISERVDALAFAQYAGTAAPGALQERSRLLAERDDLLEKIRIRDPRWRTVTEPAPVDIDMIRKRLGGERAALVLFHKANQVVAAVIDSAGIACGVRDLTPKTVASITSFAANLRKPRPNEYLFDLSKEEKVALEDLLPANVLERASTAATLIVIPHGILHLLPWACLTIGNERLFERSAVGVLPNLASLPLLDDVPIPDPVVAIIGAADYSGLTKYRPLKESAQEIVEVERTYQGRVVSAPRTGSDATEATFWELAAEAEGSDPILHFSGHGSLDPSEPLASGLVLTGSTVDAAELLSRRIPYQEVVLSACSTGWRPQTTHDLELSGDDALGIPASFLEAGAQFLLASIPPALETSSRRFTVAWHRQRRSGLSPLQAYRAVQLESYAAAPDEVFSFAGTTAYGCR